MEVPSSNDANGDKVADSLGTAVDLDGDGNPDPFDLNMDGTPDGPGVDTDGDGIPDAIGVDTNGDGIYDALDLDGDGDPDEHAVDEVPVGDGDGDIAPGDGDGDIVVPVGDGDGDEPAEYCDEFMMEFVPRTPTVYVLVDASSSMSSLMFWEPMKTGVLNVVQQLTADVRFGFGTYTGTNAMCSGLTNATPTLDTDNFQAIADAYNAIPAPIISSNPSEKQETPTPLAIQQATDILLADDSPGDRYILLVSDGQPDFCDDQTANCAIDATVASMQLAYSLGVRTLVFAIDSDQITQPELFDYFAQAGAGEEPAWDKGLDVMPYSGVVVGECGSSPVAAQWGALRTENGNAPDPAVCMPTPPMGDPNCFLPAGDYSATGGTTTAILNSDPTALAQQILASVESLKSCVIDLNFEVKDAEEGEIFVGDLTTAIPADQWRMNTETQLELLGSACTTWQSPEVLDFFAGFPCSAIVPVVR